MTAIAMEARRRAFGVPNLPEGLPLETSPLGRLCALGDITQRQYEAITAFGDLGRRYSRALGWHPERSASDFSGSGGHPGDVQSDEELARTVSIIRRWMACHVALTGCGDPRTRSAVSGAIAGLDMAPFVDISYDVRDTVSPTRLTTDHA